MYKGYVYIEDGYVGNTGAKKTAVCAAVFLWFIVFVTVCLERRGSTEDSSWMRRTTTITPLSFQTV